MATLTGTKIQDTYSGLLKTVDNSALSGTLKNITDGLGNASTLFLSTSLLEVNGRISQVGLGNSTFVGFEAGLNDDATDNRNVGVGSRALRNNTTGASNTANGYLALYSNTTGANNVVNGSESLRNNTTGNNNVANGKNSGSLISDGTTANTITNNSVYIGAETKALADNQTNQIVIGYGAIGNGSNSVVLGNDSIATTVLRGNVGIGTTSPQNIQSPTLSVGTTRGAVKIGFGGIQDDGNTIDFSFQRPMTFSYGTMTSNTEAVRITSSGNVGIGTENPNNILDVQSTSQPSSPIPRMTAAQRVALTGMQTGDLVYQTDSAFGIYYYHSPYGWVRQTSNPPTESQVWGMITETSISSSYSINWSAYSVFNLTMVGDTTFSDFQLPPYGRSLVIQIVLTGEYVPTFPAYWKASANNDTYDGTIENLLTVSIINNAPGDIRMYYTLENIPA